MQHFVELHLSVGRPERVTKPADHQSIAVDVEFVDHLVAADADSIDFQLVASIERVDLALAKLAELVVGMVACQFRRSYRFVAVEHLIRPVHSVEQDRLLEWHSHHVLDVVDVADVADVAHGYDVAEVRTTRIQWKRETE